MAQLWVKGVYNLTRNTWARLCTTKDDGTNQEWTIIPPGQFVGMDVAVPWKWGKDNYLRVQWETVEKGQPAWGWDKNKTKVVQFTIDHVGDGEPFGDAKDQLIASTPFENRKAYGPYLSIGGQGAAPSLAKRLVLCEGPGGDAPGTLGQDHWLLWVDANAGLVYKSPLDSIRVEVALP